ncbi:diaminopimelate decarboxylase [Neisseria sp. HSC-16F19]|nr:diaminopimelate decarboxylase [Neisseria sp. HSC-16F19]MCP2040959.1 diaminopimelate decarboxylase [Neisseria sp. HSC-16F19]
MTDIAFQPDYAALAATYGTPLYVYRADALTQAFNTYRSAFGEAALFCYAVKANGNLSILRHFARLGSGFDIVSGGELARVLAAGGAADKTIFSGVGKSEAEIEYALAAGILCFNVESLPELDRINQVAARLGKTASVSLRINPDVDAQTHPYISTGLKDNKFGIAYADALGAYRHAAALPHLRVCGIDCHIGSQLINLAPMVEALERLLLLVDTLADEGIVLEHIDIGGGIGIPYREDEAAPDIRAYAQAVAARMAGRSQRLILEPGRSLVGAAGVLLTRVEFVKHGESKDFIVVDGAMNDLMRPSLYDAYHRIEAVVAKDIAPVTADVVGPICESGDFLGRDRTLAVEAGDLLLIHEAGAYAASMASNYNTRPRAAEVLLDETGQARLIRPRETVAELFAAEARCLD